jgi:hypothetical protein
MLADKQNGETRAWWEAWQPSDDEPWDTRRVVHLHRRAGFAATWKEIQRDLKDGPGATIDRVLHGKARMQAIPNDFAEMANVIGAGAVGSESANRLKAWWMYRLLFRGVIPLVRRFLGFLSELISRCR